MPLYLVAITCHIQIFKHLRLKENTERNQKHFISIQIPYCNHTKQSSPTIKQRKSLVILEWLEVEHPKKLRRASLHLLMQSMWCKSNKNCMGAEK